MVGKAKAKAYHHGNARAALLDAVETIVREEGIEGVTIRAAAKAIGVSHTAAFRHFSDKRELLTAFSTRCANALGDQMEREAAGAEDRNTAFYRIGVGYLRFALERPGAFRAVFRDALLDTEDSAYRTAMRRLEGLLVGQKSSTVDDPLPPEALLAWGATHGLATLATDGALDDLPPKTGSLENLSSVLSLLAKSI